MVRVLLADDHTVLREGLRRSLEAAGLKVVGEVGDGVEVLRAAERLLPDVILMDVSLPGQDGIEAAIQLRESLPEIRVVMLTMYADSRTLRDASRAGAVGYLVKDCTTSEIVDAVRAAASGQMVRISSTSFPLHAPRERGQLSERELEVLQLLGEGASTTEIAQRLYVSAKTVKNHLGSIYEKLDAHDRTQAVLRGLRLGLIRLH
jgi:two-component system, NarL family, response regulator DegU